MAVSEYMGNYKANTINNKKIIHQLITFAVKHKESCKTTWMKPAFTSPSTAC